MDEIDRLIIQVSGHEDVRRMTAEMNALEGQPRKGGSGILGASYAIQDFTSQINNGLVPAMASIQNNIPQILGSLGAGAGLAGTISIASVAIAALIQNWDKLSSLWDDAATKLPELKSGFEGLKETLKEIDAQIKELATDEAALDFFGAKRLAELRGLRGEAAQRQADERLVAGAGPETTRAAREQAAAVRRAVAELPEGAQTILGALAEKGIRGPAATRMVAGALRGNAQDLEDILGNVEPEGAMAGLFAATPERRRQREEEAAVFKADQARQQRQARRRREAETQLKRETAEGMADWDAQARDETARQRQVARDQAKVDRQEAAEIMGAAAPEDTARQRAMRGARRDVSAVTQGMGLTPSPEQLDQMASATLAGMSNGLDAQQAAWLSVVSKMQAIQQMTARFQAAQAQMMMGGDSSGMFSQSPGIW